MTRSQYNLLQGHKPRGSGGHKGHPFLRAGIFVGGKALFSVFRPEAILTQKAANVSAPAI